MNWSSQQQDAIDSAGRWLRRKGQQVFRLFGYAGTGKSTLARSLAGDVTGSVAFGAFTGKAALVMRSKGCLEASTIHSMLYTPRTDDRGHVTFQVNHDGPAAHASLIVIDEVSMVGRQIGTDLLSLDRPVLVLGDPAQLPPVERGRDGGGFFTTGTPDVMLTEIHRQARDNPIIALATAVREGRPIGFGAFGSSSVITRSEIAGGAVLDADQVLVGLNRTRQGYNARIRQLMGMTDPFPVPGDKLVCLKNNHSKGLLNSGIWKVHSIYGRNEDELELLVDSEEFGGMARKAVTVPRQFFSGDPSGLDWRYLRTVDQMTYGYALTVHKAQGSQWGHVLLFDESRAFRDDHARWLYTGITRAADRVTIVRAA